MTKKEYLDNRKKLMDEAQAFINAGDTEKAQEKMNEVEKLDDKWEEQAQAQANFDALNKEPVAFKAMQMEAAFGKEESAHKIEDVIASDDYLQAWAKTMQGLTLSDDEQKAYIMVDEAFTHTTQNTGTVIPKTVAKGIWEEAADLYPYFNDITKTYVNGVLALIQEDTSSDAGWYEEETETEDGKETFKSFTLNGCELSRSIEVSWKLKEMAMEEFIPYIQRRMGKKMGAGAGYGATHGAGNTNKNKPEPVGVVTALRNEKDHPQCIVYESKKLTYSLLTQARGKIKSGYSAGLKIYANNNTIWNELANVLDANKRPIFINDPSNPGKFRVLGCVVEEDASMNDGEVLFSNAAAGYHMNINKEITMTTEDHAKKRNTDYCGYAVMDGNAVTTKAHSLLTTEAFTEPSQNTGDQEGKL